MITRIIEWSIDNRFMVLMLTAIVVSVATFGVAMALCVKIYQRYQTLEEDELRMRLSEK